MEKSRLQLLRSLSARGDAKVDQSVGMAVGRYRQPQGVTKAACSLQENSVVIRWCRSNIIGRLIQPERRSNVQGAPIVHLSRQYGSLSEPSRLDVMHRVPQYWIDSCYTAFLLRNFPIFRRFPYHD